MQPVFKVLRNGLLRYKPQTCPSCDVTRVQIKCYAVDCLGTYFTRVQSYDVTRFQKCYGVDCVGTYFTRVQSCDVTRVQSAAQSSILRTCPKLWCNPCSKWYGMDCFGTYLTHVQSCDVTRVQIKCHAVECLGTYFTHVQSCDVTRVPSATQWTASVHTSHMSKAVMERVFKVLRSGLLRCILHTCPKLWCNPCSKCCGMDCFGTYLTHVQRCDVTRVQSATQWTASVQTSHMSKAVM